eukprot:m.486647 g.486647  ORF g.486647 m.486647 type:complete len:528 (-) comp24541_c0_seq1:74-1657(-)
MFAVFKFNLVFAGLCAFALVASGSASTNDHAVTLRYFNIRGLAEPIRLTLEYLGIEWNEVAYDRCGDQGCPPGVEDWDEAKQAGLESGLFPFGQVPSLTIDGHDLVQSHAILRFLARRFQFGGSTPDEELAVDIVAGGAQDLRTRYSKLVYNKASVEDPTIIEEYKDMLGTWLPFFERLLVQAGGVWFINPETVTYADVLMFDILDHNLRILPDCLDDTPALRQFVYRFAQLPPIQSYLSSERRRSHANGGSAAMDTPTHAPDSVPDYSATPAESDEPAITLRYFNIRGLAEPIRLALAYLGLDYHEVAYDQCVDKECPPGVEDWSKAKEAGIHSGLFPFGQVPSLTYNRVNLVQSHAILRFLGRMHHLGGASDELQVTVDIVAGGAQDLRSRYSKLVYDKDSVTDTTLLDEYKTMLATWLPNFERLLVKAGGKWFANQDHITYADILMFDILDHNLRIVPTCLDKTPELRSFVHRFAHLPGIHEYLVSDRRRTRANGNSAAMDTPSAPPANEPDYSAEPEPLHSEL